ncbi:alpha/beta-hydrolase [Hypoxylon fragiforme]|uniref:alpha/beta-hydrolase n=1 Tax=Hypoxylon fragiforme TaxID=63214 RepID=UPI0020C71E74|nr:alpha/beta-hydrolase [Hypoxylon fragiforme]KAI2607039.1 alpha/beta-hydrolase [Hypoxylon fragiforme]
MQTVEGIPVPTRSTPDEATRDTIPPHEKPKKAKDKTGAPPSRFSLRMTAGWWRSLQCIGMGLHFLAPPRPPNPDFFKSIPSTLSDQPGQFNLSFYVPEGYNKDPNSSKWPVVVNFHGGGFTLGSASDDARFARFILEKCRAVFVSVDYRLAPECPFPTAVDDGADALLYIINNATELRLDSNRIATSGFSAGGNIAITAPIRLHEHRQTAKIPEYRILAIATWYPITDYTLSRAERRASAIRPEATLPPVLTNLFDASYLFPPELNLSHPCLSPSRASDELLKESLPPNVIFYTCEWDMLLPEGKELAERLQRPPIEKNVYYTMVPGVAHGWDKGPNPMKPPPKSEKLYGECCKRLRSIFEEGQTNPSTQFPIKLAPRLRSGQKDGSGTE